MTSTNTTPAAAASPAWGTAKTHGLQDGDEFLYFGKDRKAPAAEGTLRTFKIDGVSNNVGGHATRFWATPVTGALEASRQAEKPAKAAKAPKAEAAPKAPKAPALTPEQAKAARNARRAERKAARAQAAPAGYTLARAHSSFSVFKLAEGGEGAAWLCQCSHHGTTKGADSASAAVALGRKEARPTWCKACAK